MILGMFLGFMTMIAIYYSALKVLGQIPFFGQFDIVAARLSTSSVSSDRHHLLFRGRRSRLSDQ